MRAEVPFPRLRAVRVDQRQDRPTRRPPCSRLAVDVWGERRKRISTPELNKVIGAATLRQRRRPGKLGPRRSFYATQVAVAPPTFVFFARHASQVHFSYKRFLGEPGCGPMFGLRRHANPALLPRASSGPIGGPRERGRGGHGPSGTPMPRADGNRASPGPHVRTVRKGNQRLESAAPAASATLSASRAHRPGPIVGPSSAVRRVASVRVW